jgi:hypothetical protein
MHRYIDLLEGLERKGPFLTAQSSMRLMCKSIAVALDHIPEASISRIWAPPLAIDASVYNR